MSLLRYSAAFISRRKCGLQVIDRELFRIYGGLHPKSDVDRLHIPKKDRRDLIAIEDFIEFEGGGLAVYFNGSEEKLSQTARGDRIDGLEAASVLKKAKKEKRLQDWEEKALHGQYLRQKRSKLWA